MTTQTIVVAVDGPAGSGKSSVSRAAADALGFRFLDTGAAYRALAWHVLDRGDDPDDADAVERAVQEFPYAIGTQPAERWVRVGDADVTDAIREPRVTRVVSSVARVPAVREALTARFRETMAAGSGIVVEGRDITTVVAADAAVRVLLTASAEARAARRAGELGVVDHAAVGRAIAERDAKDARTVDFMTAAAGVTTLDSTDLDFASTVQALVALVRGADA